MAGPEGRAPGPDRTATDRSDADRRSADVRSAHRRGIGHRIGRRWWMAGLAIAALVVIVLAPLASPDPDGLDRVAHQHGFLGSALGPLWDLLPDYRFPGLDGDLSTIVAGLIGVALVAVVMLGLGRLLGGTTAPTGDDGPRPATSNGERPPTRDRPSTRPGLDRPDDGRTDG